MAPKLNPKIKQWILDGAWAPYPIHGDETTAMASASKHRGFALRHGFDIGYGRTGGEWFLLAFIPED